MAPRARSPASRSASRPRRAARPPGGANRSADDLAVARTSTAPTRSGSASRAVAAARREARAPAAGAAGRSRSAEEGSGELPGVGTRPGRRPSRRRRGRGPAAAARARRRPPCRPWRCRRAWRAGCRRPARRVGELARLGERVLTGGGVEHQERPRCQPAASRSMTRPDLAELGHQVVLGVEPAGGVDDQLVGAARPRRLDGVEDHRRRIGARLPGGSPRRPAARPRARAARWRRRGRCRRRRAGPARPACWARRASLAIEVVLPTPLTPTTRVTRGAGGPGARRRRVEQQAARSRRPGAARRRAGARPRRRRLLDAARPARATVSTPRSAPIRASSRYSSVRRRGSTLPSTAAPSLLDDLGVGHEEAALELLQKLLLGSERARRACSRLRSMVRQRLSNRRQSPLSCASNSSRWSCAAGVFHRPARRPTSAGRRWTSDQVVAVGQRHGVDVEACPSRCGSCAARRGRWSRSARVWRR